MDLSADGSSVPILFFARHGCFPVSRVRHPAPGQQDFEVKRPFIQGNQVEHIWVSDVRLVGNRVDKPVVRSERGRKEASLRQGILSRSTKIA